MMGDWWGLGIVHAKVWISDGKDVYIGSANNGWKSHTQVKEVGIYLVNCSSIAKKTGAYFDNLWKLSSLNASAHTKTVWDKQWQVRRKLQCWSHFVPLSQRCRSPLPSYIDVPHVVGYPILADAYMFHVQIKTPGYIGSSVRHASYLSFAPPELSFGRFQADEQGWADTIKSVKFGGSVRISTMDWLGQSQYFKQTVYWQTLSSATTEVAFSKHATVKLLVAYWAHFITNTYEYLKHLLYSSILCTSSKYNTCAEKVEIKYYIVSGYNLIGAAVTKRGSTGNIYPGYSRVNHGEYVVSTSTLIWDYCYTTAGVSFGTYNSNIVAQLQQVFDADWNSPYAVPVEPLELDLSPEVSLL